MEFLRKAEAGLVFTVKATQPGAVGDRSEWLAPKNEKKDHEAVAVRGLEYGVGA